MPLFGNSWTDEQIEQPTAPVSTESKCVVITLNNVTMIDSGRYYTALLVHITPDSKVHGANRGPIWDRQDPGGPLVGPMNLVIWDTSLHNDVIVLRYHYFKAHH